MQISGTGSSHSEVPILLKSAFVFCRFLGEHLISVPATLLLTQLNSVEENRKIKHSDVRLAFYQQEKRFSIHLVVEKAFVLLLSRKIYPVELYSYSFLLSLHLYCDWQHDSI